MKPKFFFRRRNNGPEKKSGVYFWRSRINYKKVWAASLLVPEFGKKMFRIVYQGFEQGQCRQGGRQPWQGGWAVRCVQRAWVRFLAMLNTIQRHTNRPIDHLWSMDLWKQIWSIGSQPGKRRWQHKLVRKSAGVVLTGLQGSLLQEGYIRERLSHILRKKCQEEERNERGRLKDDS